MATSSKTVFTLIIGAIVGIGPAYFGYLQSHDELKTKYQESHDDAAGGYTALAESVKELQASVTLQHDYIIKLETHLDDMDKYMTETRKRVATTDHHPAVEATPAPKPPAPPVLPKFGDLPNDFTDAATKFAP